MSQSPMSGYYKLSVSERIARLEHLGYLSSAQARQLQNGAQILSASAADKMIENSIGVFGLPLAVAPGFIINGREFLVPLVVEEPSIVAALSAAASRARETGGFATSAKQSLLAGQVYVSDIGNEEVALQALRAASDELLQLADNVHPRLRARGGGVRDIEFRLLRLSNHSPLIAVHILVDTCDAMGANLVNTICEAVGPRIADICAGNTALQILSNLVDHSLVTATVRFSSKQLATGTWSGAEVRDRIVLSDEIARVDPYRAATHNKGIMNGIDAVAVATGNDWRAIEAGAHAFAARNGTYSSLTRWSVADNDDLLGELSIPLKTGIVGGTATMNPAASMGLAIAGVESARQLSEVMAAVGLAQNFAALRALATTGIQEGHMRLHARSIAASAGTPDSRLDEVVDKLIASGEIKRWKAEQILCDERKAADDADAATSKAAGKVILFGEHAAVYGRRALAIPIVDAVVAAVTSGGHRTTLVVRDWNLQMDIDTSSSDGIDGIINLIFEQLGVTGHNYHIDVRSRIPHGMGLGSSAALAVSITRAIAVSNGMEIDDSRANAIAFACEKLAHGTPSGLDNTLSCYAKPMLFRNRNGLEFETLPLEEPVPLVIAFSNDIGLTEKQVGAVRLRREQAKTAYEAIFDQIDGISSDGSSALQAGRYDELGRLMNVCHGLLNAIGVSTPDLENLVTVARQNGALGAKLTGAGGGGAIVALCPGSEDIVSTALRQAGYKTLTDLHGSRV